MQSPFRPGSFPKRAALYGIVLLPVVFALLVALTPQQPSPATLPGGVDPIERGEYLVTAMGCNDCHTPFAMGPNGPEPDMTRMLSGHPEDLVMPPPPELEGPWLWVGAATNTAYAGPWGISYAMNLTSDEETGLGAWTEEMFVKAIQTGWHMGVENSRRIMPPMPWPAYSHLPEEDLKAIYAYLQVIPPVKNTVPAYQPPAADGR